MADDPRKVGRPDRDRVSKQPHEIDHLVKKTGMPAPLVEKIVEQVGPSRKAVEKKLDDMKRNRKR